MSVDLERFEFGMYRVVLSLYNFDASTSATYPGLKVKSVR